MGFLEVLKIIGIVIGGLIVFIIAVVGIILASPIFYRGRVIYKEKAYVNIKVCHIFRFVYGFLYYKDEVLDYYLRVLWEKIDDEDEPDDDTSLFGSLSKAAGLGSNDSKKKESDGDTKESKKKQKQKKSIFKRLKDIYNDIKKKILGLIKNFKDIWAAVTDKENREAVVYFLKMIKIPIKYLVQNKLKVKMKFGMEDPAQTGELLGVMYSVSALLGFELMVEPDFDNKVFELDARLRGHVSVYKVLVWVLQLYSNDKLKIVIDDVL